MTNMETRTENLGKNGVWTLHPNGGGDPIRIEINNGECLLHFTGSYQLQKGTGAPATGAAAGFSGSGGSPGSRG